MVLDRNRALRFLLAVVSLLTAALGTGYVFECLRMPRVVDEITGRLALGPSVLGGRVPDTYQWLFAAAAGQRLALEVFYWLGLVLSCSFRASASSGISLATTALRAWSSRSRRPYLRLPLGSPRPPFSTLSPYVGSAGNLLAFRLVLGIAVVVTSIPVISQILYDNLQVGLVLAGGRTLRLSGGSPRSCIGDAPRHAQTFRRERGAAAEPRPVRR